MPTFEGASRKDAAKKALRQRPVLVLFYMIGCPHCEKNKPAWEDAKAKAPKDVKIVEVDMEATPEDEGVEGFPTMKYKPAVGTPTKASGEKQSGEEILKELGVPSKTGGSKRRRRTHRSRHRKFLRRTLRNYVAL
jgi:thiol-disulfide isomerase/thioredoxin